MGDYEKEVELAAEERTKLRSSHLERASPNFKVEIHELQCSKQVSIYQQKQTFDYPIVKDRSRFRILLVRHGQSLGNVKPALYQKMSDHAIPLSQLGQEQARAAAMKIKEFYQENPDPNDKPSSHYRRVWVSPYKRARETAKQIISVLGDEVGDLKESIFLGEQQFGLFEGLSPVEVAKQYATENEHFNKAIKYGGRFWARMPLGESRFDVTARVDRFFEQLMEDQQKHGIEDIIVVSHGTTCRAFVMMWLNRTPEWFEDELNPNNCAVRLIEGKKDLLYKVCEGFREPRRPTPKKKEDQEKHGAEAESGMYTTKGGMPSPLLSTKVEECPLQQNLKHSKGKEIDKDVADAGETQTTLENNKADTTDLQITPTDVDDDDDAVGGDLQIRKTISVDDDDDKYNDPNKLLIVRSTEDDVVSISRKEFMGLLKTVKKLEQTVSKMKKMKTRVFTDKAKTWVNYSGWDDRSWVTLLSREILINKRSHVHVIAQGMATVAESVNEETMTAMDAAIFFDDQIFSPTANGCYGHGTAIVHSHSWVPAVAMAEQVLERGCHEISLKFHIRGGSRKFASRVYFNGPIMTTTVSPL